MNVFRMAKALRDMADALDEDRAKPLTRSSTRIKAVRVPPADEPVDEVTRARALRIIRAKGFVKGKG